MGFWITLECNIEGDPHSVGGTDEATMSITYNYSEAWPKALGAKPEGPYHEHYGLGPWLHQRTAKATEEILRACISALGDKHLARQWRIG